MELNDFLVRAKKSTYASRGEGNEEILEDGTKRLIHSEDGFEYVDQYKGFNPFEGDEVVSQNGEIIWRMHYQGGAETQIVPINRIYEFLKTALSGVSKEKPFRGPEEFEEGLFLYTNEIEGDLRKFNGIEKIFFEGQQVYDLIYHGGMEE